MDQQFFRLLIMMRANETKLFDGFDVDNFFGT